MKDERKTKAQLIEELKQLHRRLSEMEAPGSEHRRAEQEIEDQKRFIDTALEAVPDLFVVYNLQGKPLRWNRAFREHTGYGDQEIGNMMAWDFHPKKDVQFVAESFAKVVETGKEMYIETSIKNRDGRSIPSVLSGSLLKDKDGNPIGICGVGRDITERKRAEDALTESEEKYRLLNENIPVVVYSALPDEHSTNLFISGRIVGLTGYTGEQFLENPELGWEIVHPVDRERVRKNVKEHREERSDLDIEYRITTKDGVEKWIKDKATPVLDSEGQIIRMDGFIEDITGRKRAEENLEKYAYNLEERIKELNCLYGISDIAKKQDISLEEIVQGIVNIIPRAWRYPDITCARITFEGREFKTDNFEETAWKQSSDIIVHGRKAGAIDVYYLEEKPEEDEGPFLTEERGLINTIANRLKEETERKKAEEAVRQSERYHRSLIRNAPDMVSIYDVDGTIRWASRTARRITGYLPEDAYGRNILDFVHPDDIGSARDVLDFILQNPGVPKSFEARFRHKDGSWFFLEAICNNLLDDPSVHGIVVNSRDITERKLIQKRLGSMNRLFLSLGPDIIENIEAIVRTGKGILGGALMQYCRLQEGKLSSISTLPGEEGFKVTDRPEDHVCNVVFSKGGDKPLIIEDLREARYGDTYPEVQRRGLRSFAGYPVKLGKETIGCLSLWDRSKRGFSREELEILGTMARTISIEEERLAREEDLKDFIDIASHELRHPITLMKGYAASLREFWGELDDEKRMEMLDGIDNGAYRMDKLSRELLEVSRIERGHFRLDRQEVPLEPLVERAVSEMRKKGLENRFNLSIPGDMGAQEVDPERLVELMIILLDNAAQFSPPSSEIDIEVEAGDEGALVSVLDRGQGIPEGDRERVFERFYQVEEALHHSKPGIGLGLYIAREIVEAHGGRIWCEPREGGGSIFRFTLPM